jgi:hypothetical protein
MEKIKNLKELTKCSEKINIYIDAVNNLKNAQWLIFNDVLKSSNENELTFEEGKAIMQANMYCSSFAEISSDMEKLTILNLLIQSNTK